ncbi:hypothetical protein Glove_169g52 [Diversispora epigaea]|uniref:Uncharacterized protein n=1 Tax=Diversispora epigaea TaxID=1348612 RepID=A0A397ISH1_9GLOM|nr:hypothetical protein Glove_169g52 [Diversispora epigaea]
MKTKFIILLLFQVIVTFTLAEIPRVPTNEINTLNFRFTHNAVDFDNAVDLDNVVDLDNAVGFDVVDFDNIEFPDDQPGSGFYFILACFIIIGIIFQTHNTAQNPSNPSLQELKQF